MTRDEAINLLDNMLGMVQDNHGSDYDKAIHMAIDALKQPERKTGKWERHYSRPNVYADLCWYCSVCGYASCDNWANKFNFCPNCGARLVQKGEDNGQND